MKCSFIANHCWIRSMIFASLFLTLFWGENLSVNIMMIVSKIISHSGNHIKISKARVVMAFLFLFSIFVNFIKNVVSHVAMNGLVLQIEWPFIVLHQYYIILFDKSTINLMAIIIFSNEVLRKKWEHYIEFWKCSITRKKERIFWWNLWIDYRKIPPLDNLRK